jgi:hypothetical protein
MKHARRRQGSGSFDLIEESTHLLRTAQVATLAVYYLGAIPFVLGLLFFWADMSRSPFASDHLAEASLAMALLFIWMKFWQVIFARRLRAQRTGKPPEPLNFRRSLRILIAQTILQPLGLFLIPLSAIPLLPFAWVYAFYQNVTVLADGRDGVLQLFKKSHRQAVLWPAQNNLSLAILVAFGLYVFLNWATVCLVLPQLLKMLCGIESIFTKSPWSMLNSTFSAAMFGLTYLCVDPIIKAFYTLRCFYGESLQSGEDLKAELKPYALSLPKIAALFLTLFIISFSSPAKAADAAPSADAKASSQVSSPDLDKAINQTIHERKYTWRMPREKMEETDAQEGAIAKFFEKIGDMLRKCARAVAHWLEWLFRKLFGGSQPVSYDEGTGGYGWAASVKILLWALVIAAVLALIVFLCRVWLKRQKQRSAVVGEAILPVPDITDENVGADQLPEEGWTRLARELLARGEFRLAMRAFYLASLSHLAAQNLITIARFKSNRDYARELQRRGHAFPGVLSLFGQNISVFEAIWYGMHEVNSDSVNQFALNVERIKSGG